MKHLLLFAVALCPPFVVTTTPAKTPPPGRKPAAAPADTTAMSSHSTPDAFNASYSSNNYKYQMDRYRNGNEVPVPIIIDTDMSIDCDDVGALCIAHALMDLGKAKILAVVHDVGIPDGIGAVSVINHYYGRDDIPLGAFKGNFGRVYPHHYVKNLVKNFPSPIKNYSQVPEAVTTYRTVLSQVDDLSVTIASIGDLTNLENLLKSKADDISPLSGVELVSKTVKRIVIMGGKYPSSYTWPLPEWNFGGVGLAKCDDSGYKCPSASANYTIGHIPDTVELIFTGYEVGKRITSGAKMSTCLAESNPCRQAYIDREGFNNSRFSWDPSAILDAVLGIPEDLYQLVGHGGRNEIDIKTGNNQWINSSTEPGGVVAAVKIKTPNERYLYLKNQAAGESIGEMIDELLCKPRNSTHLGTSEV